MEVLFERVAGLDVGKASVTVCVRVLGWRQGSRSSQTRTFKTTAGSLRVMRDWLVECGVTVRRTNQMIGDGNRLFVARTAANDAADRLQNLSGSWLELARSAAASAGN